MFVKIETSWKFNALCAWDEPAPRNIINASAFVRVILGPWMHAFGAILRKNWNIQGPLTFKCSYTARTLGLWFERARLVPETSWFEIDYSRWDSTVSKPMIALGLEIFALFGLSGLGARAYKSMFTFKATSRDGISVSRTPCQKSGVPMTTVLNSILNGLVTKFMFAEAGVDWRSCPTMVGGDDMISRAPAAVARKALDVAKNLGLKPKMKFGHPDAKVTFCSGAFWPSSRGTIFGPTLKAMFKTAYTISPVPFSHWRQHAKGVALGLVNQTSHIPVLRAYISQLIKLTCRVADDKWTRAAVASANKKHVRCLQPATITTESFSFMAQRYGVSADDLECTERLVATATGCGFLVHPVLTRLSAQVFSVEG